MDEGKRLLTSFEKNQLRLRWMREGREDLELIGINPDDYEEYFEIMKENDIPLVNNFPVLENLTLSKKTFEGYQESWGFILKLYSKIDLKKQNKETGKGIIKKTKVLFKRFDQLFQKHVAKAKEIPNSKKIYLPKPPKELEKLQDLILKETKKYRQLPAYIAYREYGIHKIDAHRRHLKQKNK